MLKLQLTRSYLFFTNITINKFIEHRLDMCNKASVNSVVGVDDPMVAWNMGQTIQEWTK